MNRLLILLAAAVVSCASSLQQANVRPPVIDCAPSDTLLTLDQSGFANARIRVMNLGGGILTIKRIAPSCGCASASVQRNNIDSAGTGMFVIGINGKNVSDSLNVVEFLVESNATVSPFRVRVRVQRATIKE